MRSLRFLVITTLSVQFGFGGLAQELSDEEQIRLTRSQSNQAIARHDVDGILESMADDYHVSTSSGTLLEGRAEIGEAFASRFAEFKDARYQRTTESIDLNTTKSIASEAGAWVGSWTTPDGPFRTGGNYLAYWRKINGRWLIHAELFVPLFCEGSGCG